MNRYFNTKQTRVQMPLPIGAAAVRLRLKTAPASAVIQKTKALINLFHPTESGYYYEPEPIGGSVASRIVRNHKVEKTKQLFEMFHLG